jgi:hypothetical protein
VTREAVNKVIERMHRHRLRLGGHPSGKEVRAMEKKAQKIAEVADKKKIRK